MSKSFCIILSKAGGIIHGNELMLARAQGSSKIQWMSIILGYHFFFFMKLKFLGQHLVGAGKVGCFFFFFNGLKKKKTPTICLSSSCSFLIVLLTTTYCVIINSHQISPRVGLLLSFRFSKSQSYGSCLLSALNLLIFMCKNVDIFILIMNINGKQQM